MKRVNYQKRYKRYISIFFVALICMSCEKFLDEKPNKSLTVPKTLDEIQGLFNDATRMNLNLTPSYGESSADDYFVAENTYNSRPSQFQQVYTWSLREYVFKNDWATNYQPVYNSNFALESLEKIARTPQNEYQWNLIKGYALFWRAYCFLNLSWQHAKAYDPDSANLDLGIVLRNSSDFNIPSVRSSVKESYDKLLADAKEASTLLPANSSHVFLPSKAACYGLLARAYLSMRVYDSAFRYSDLCLTLKDDILDYNSLSLNANLPFPRLNNPETIFYTEMNTLNLNHSSAYGFIDTVLYSSYSSPDLRKKGFFRQNGSYFRFKGSYSGNSVILFSGLATDEILLIRAEANARKGAISEAMEDLNTLLQKRWDNTVPYLPETANTSEEAIVKIISERRKELLMRGIRWSDIKRLNKEGRNITPIRVIGNQQYSLMPNENRYALPLPNDIINMTGMPQNP